MVNPITIEDALDYCLANPDNLSNDELLARFPQYAEQLQPLLTLGIELGGMTPPPVSPALRGAMKQRIVSAAGARQAARPVALPAAKGMIIPWPRFVWASAALAAALVLFFWYASSSALPGNALYGVKLATERVSVNLAQGPADQVRAHTALANTRLGEIETLNVQHELVRAEQPINDYHYHINLSASTLDKLQDGEQVELAKAVYQSSVKGSNLFRKLQAEQGQSVPAPVEASLERVISSTDSINRMTARVLEAAGISPATVAIAEGVATPTVPFPVTTPLRNPTTAPGTSPSISPSAASGSTNGRATVIARGGTATRAAGTEVAGNPGGARTQVPGARSTATATTGRIIILPTTPTPRLVPADTNTPVIGRPRTATPLPVPPTRPVLNTPAATATRVVGPPDRTPPAGQATHTPRPLPSPAATRTHEPPPPASPTPEPPTPIPPTYTSVPLPTDTDTPTTLPTSTYTYTPVPPTETLPPTFTPEDTYTPTAVPALNVCDLQVDAVDASCASGSCVSWSAQISNGQFTFGQISWTAELQIKQTNGGFRTVASSRGSSNVTPGGATASGTICYTFPADTEKFKIRFSIDPQGSQCSPQGTSGAMDPCIEAGSTPTREPTNTREVRLTNTPRPTNTERPTNTPRPSNTPHSRPQETPGTDS